MASAKIPTDPLLPAPANTDDYHRRLNLRLYELLRVMATKINELEARIKELEP